MDNPGDRNAPQAYPYNPNFPPQQEYPGQNPGYPAYHAGFNQDYSQYPANQPAPYYPGAYDYQQPPPAIIVQQMPLPIVVVNEVDLDTLKIVKYSRIMIYLSFIEALLLIFLLIGVYFFILMLFPLILGIFAGRRFDSKLTIAFMISIIIIIIFRIVVAVLVPEIYVFVIIGIMIIGDLVVLGYAFKFFSLVRPISEDRRQELVSISNGRSWWWY